MPDHTSNIPSFFSNKSVLITGVTGFLGKVLLEKLLRSCPEIKRCYVLIRTKKRSDHRERLDSVLNCPLFEPLEREVPDFKNKIIPVSGDLLEPRLGMSEQDEQMVTWDTDVIFHSAAEIRFDLDLKAAIKMNVLGVRQILQLAKKCKHLKALVHVSTAYSNCDKLFVKEEVYDPLVHLNNIIEFTQCMEDDVIRQITSTIIDPHPNTYTYSKAMAEFLLKEERDELPLAIVRPSIIMPALQEPIPGWSDGINGMMTLMMAVHYGLLVSVLGNPSCIADFIPVDLVCNAIIASAWYIANSRNHDVFVYNCTSGQVNNITWKKFEVYAKDSIKRVATKTTALLPIYKMRENRIWHSTLRAIFQTIPSYTMDFGLWVTRKQSKFVRIQKKIHKATTLLQYFTSRQWIFQNEGLFRLVDVMSEKDRRNFNLDPATIDWRLFIQVAIIGLLKYIYNDQAKKTLHEKELQKQISNDAGVK